VLEYCAESELHPRSGLGMLKGRKIFLIEGVFRSPGSTATFGAGRPFYRYLGLKPQAKSYYPFGISPQVFTDEQAAAINSSPPCSYGQPSRLGQADRLAGPERSVTGYGNPRPWKNRPLWPLRPAWTIRPP
jgi:hypothetical protein